MGDDLPFSARHTPGTQEKKWKSFVSTLVVKIGVLLAVCGQLKACTMELAGRNAAKRGMMSYSRYTKVLLKR